LTNSDEDEYQANGGVPNTLSGGSEEKVEENANANAESQEENRRPEQVFLGFFLQLEQIRRQFTALLDGGLDDFVPVFFLFHLGQENNQDNDDWGGKRGNDADNRDDVVKVHNAYFLGFVRLTETDVKKLQRME
jgi:hypothetical protein